MTKTIYDFRDNLVMVEVFLTDLKYFSYKTEPAFLVS